MRISRLILAATLALFLTSIAAAAYQGTAQQILSIDVDGDNIYISDYHNLLYGSVKAYSRQTNELLSEIETVTYPEEGDIPIDFIPMIELFDGQLYTISHNGRVMVFSIEPELSLSIDYPVSNASLVYLAVDDNYVYTYDIFGKLHVSNRFDLSPVMVLENLSSGRILFSSDGSHLYGVSDDGLLRKWDTSD